MYSTKYDKSDTKAIKSASKKYKKGAPSWAC